MSNNKTCTRCGEEKPATLEYFHKQGEALRPACKVCRLKSAKAYHKASRENRKAYYQANKDAIAEQKKAYYQANRGAVIEKSKAYHEANREVVIEQKKAYYRTPKGKFKSIKASAKKRRINFSLLFELYETQLWGKPCHYCGCKVEVTGLDRKDSSKDYSPDNVVPCCSDCNSKKQDKPYEQFIQEQKERGS